MPSFRDLLDPSYLVSGAFSLEKMERYVERTLPINDFSKLPHQVFITAVQVSQMLVASALMLYHDWVLFLVVLAGK